MGSNLTGWHGLILLVVVLLLFAAPKLPVLACSLAQSITIFRGEVRTKDDAAESTTTDDVSSRSGA